MFFGVVLMCLANNPDDCRLFYVQSYKDNDACTLGVQADAKKVEAGLAGRAKLESYKCLYMPKGEPI